MNPSQALKDLRRPGRGGFPARTARGGLELVDAAGAPLPSVRQVVYFMSLTQQQRRRLQQDLKNTAGTAS